jgi:glycosyltransferase involved in cell wall biosynthesis
VLAEHSEWHLVLAGPDQVGWQSKLQQQAQRLGIESRITWTGMIRGAMKWGALRAAEVFVLPSHQENFGIVVAEALAAGTPTLISNKVNIWREIERDGAGLVADDTLTGTCEVFRSYIRMPEEQRVAMSQHASRCFEQRFEIKKTAEALYGTLAGVTGVKQTVLHQA